jgi:murein L,D-transpeptidase YcbB/YkuD
MTRGAPAAGGGLDARTANIPSPGSAFSDATQPGPTTAADVAKPKGAAADETKSDQGKLKPGSPDGNAASAATSKAAEGNGLDAAPAEADPLTPAPDDSAPARAPGAPQRSANSRSVAEIDPFIAALRERLAAWPESRAKADQDDLSALKGYYGEGDAVRLWTAPQGLSPRAEAARKAFERAGEWGLDAAAFDFPTLPGTSPRPEALLDVEIQIGLEVLKYARHARGGRINPPDISRMIDMRPRLYEPRSVIEAIAEASNPDTYLESLHPRHAGFIALKSALAKLRGEHGAADTGSGAKQKSQHTASSDERRIIVNMERWRWLPDDLGEFHVWDNIPEQITRVFHDGKIVHQAKIVAGKPSTPTPIFSAPMRFVIFHPSWGVPDGIKSNELGPMLRRAQANSYNWFFSSNDGASRVLHRHQLRVYMGGREINPDSVNWSSVDIRRFSFTQPPSSRNVLGIVKFRFPNKHDVYMHDTSERHLFSRKSRLYSHGCMRVENPLELATAILAYDKGWSRERISQIVARGSTSDVTLDKRVNVHVVYFTAVADREGKVHWSSDSYGIDSRTASALAGRSVVLSSAQVDEDVHAARPPRRRATPKTAAPRRQARTTQTPAGGRPWNPFKPTHGN